MKFPGKRTLYRGGRWLKSRLQSGVIILGYHRITDDEDPYNICVSPDNFREQLAIIRKFTQPILLQDLPALFADGHPTKNRIVITFDDGYQDNLTAAAPLLREWEMPATVFITNGNLGQPFWWDELAHGIKTEAGQQIMSEIIPVNPPQPADADNRMNLLLSAYQQLLQSGFKKQNEIISSLRALRKNDTQLPRALTSTELKLLANFPNIEIGGHTVSHPCLKHLARETQAREINDCKSELERLSGKSVAGFSYPNGSFSEVTAQLVRSAGFRYACCSREDISYPQSGMYQLPRFWVPNIPGKIFERWLRRWL